MTFAVHFPLSKSSPPEDSLLNPNILRIAPSRAEPRCLVEIIEHLTGPLRLILVNFNPAAPVIYPSPSLPELLSIQLALTGKYKPYA